MQGRLQIEQTITAPDLPQALTNEVGLFFVQYDGQAYLARCKEGHSLESLRAIGPRVPTVNTGVAAQNWIITKISDSIEFASGLEQSRGQSAR